MHNKHKFVIPVLVLGILVLIGAGCGQQGATLPDCPFECCADGQYEIKDCPAGYACKNNKCVSAGLVPGEGEEEEEGEEDWMPGSDQASGMEPMTRYPGSVMYKYRSPAWEDMPVSFSAEINYKTTDDFDTVLNWYRAQRSWQEAPGTGEEINLYSITATEYLEVNIMSDAALQRTWIGILYYTD